MTAAQATLDELSQHENFATWTFGRLTQALKYRAEADKRDEGRESIFGLPKLPPLGEGPHPWDGEPDKIQWIDPSTGYDCLIVRNHMGALCGYVGVPPGHPFHGVDYGSCGGGKCDDDEDGLMAHCDHSPESTISVHGGLTFSDFCQPGEPVDGICHRAMDGRPEKVWWLGFDCGHAWDVMPGMTGVMGIETDGTSYKTIAYVAEQCAVEAIQLKAVELEQRVTTAEVAQAVQSITSDTRPKVE